MKWTPEHDAMLGRELLLFELWRFKNGSRERGQCLNRIAESLNQIKAVYFDVSQKSVRDRLKILERDFKKKNAEDLKASGTSTEETEIDKIMRDYLERREEQEKEEDKEQEKKNDKLERIKHQLKQCEIKPCNICLRSKERVMISL